MCAFGGAFLPTGCPGASNIARVCAGILIYSCPDTDGAHTWGMVAVVEAVRRSRVLVRGVHTILIAGHAAHVHLSLHTMIHRLLPSDRLNNLRQPASKPGRSPDEAQSTGGTTTGKEKETNRRKRKGEDGEAGKELGGGGLTDLPPSQGRMEKGRCGVDTPGAPCPNT